MTPFDAAVLIFVLLGFGVVGTMIHFDRIRRRIRRIERLSLAGDLDGAWAAARDWERAIRKKDINQRILIAREWSKLGDHGRSLSILDDTKIPAGRYWRRFRWAADDIRHQELWAAGRLVEAAQLKAAVVALDPEAPWLVSALLRQVRSSGDPEELDAAIDLGLRLIRANSLSLEVEFDLYLTARRSARSDAVLVLEAIVDGYRRAERRPWIRISPVQWYRLFSLLGEARVAAGDEQGADEAFALALDRARDKDAAEAFIANLRADGLFDAHRFGEAADAYQRVLEAGEDGNALLGLIECHRREGRLDGAFESLRRAREVGGDATWADLLEARLLSDAVRPTEAEVLVLQVGLGEDAIDHSILYTLAYVRVSHGLPGAERALRRLATLYPWTVDREDLFDRLAPDGTTWRERLEVVSGPDV